MSNIQLYKLADTYNHALTELLYNDEIPEEAALDTLEALEGEVLEKGKNITAFILNVGHEIDALKSHEDAVSRKRKALENRVQSLRSYLFINMQKCGITEIKANDGTFVAKVNAGRDSVIIDNEDELPESMIRVKREPDKTAIGKAIKDGQEVSGAHVERKPYLTIK